MSRLQELLDELCPNGVEFVLLGDSCEIKTGKGITKKDSVDEGKYPIISGGKEPMGYYNLSNRSANTVTVSRVGANAGFVSFIDVDFYLNDKCFSVIPIGKYEELLNNKFLYEYLKNIEQLIVGMQSEGGVPTINTMKVASVAVPVPPLEVQREIVRVLDSFTLLTDELTEELNYQNVLFNELAYRLLVKDNSGEMQTVEEICIVEKGKSAIQKTLPGEYPLVVTTTERKSSDAYQFDTKAVCIPLVSSRGHGIASLNHVYYQEGKFALGNILCAVVSKDESVVLAKYLYYYFECTKDYTLVPLMKGGANVAMHIPDIKRLNIKVPSIEEQGKIINKLEILEEYCKVLLPREIELRKLQNEYYRDKLLSFKELGA